MNILAIGDVVGEIGCKFLKEKLPKLKEENDIDFTVINGENSAKRNGISKASARYIFECGADVITTGNHAFRNNSIFESFESEPYLIRPANYPQGAFGRGYCIFDMLRYRVCVINLIGCSYIESFDNPFYTMDRILKKIRDKADIIIVDFHAEASGEKGALAYYLDGRVSVIFGTHTHVQTSDEQILPKGTGFITDIGMTGPIHSVLGVKPELVIRRMKTKMPTSFLTADGKCHMDGVVFTVDEKSGRCTALRRIKLF